MKIKELIKKYPFLESFFSENGYDIKNHEEETFEQYLDGFNEEYFEDKATTKENILLELENYIKTMKEFLGISEDGDINSLTLIAGFNKSNEKENFEALEIKKSQIIAIVGPTGSGKSRLLQDIEWMAQKDTPTKRQVLINGEVPDIKKRYASNNKLVAQLSQNMNFVMDLKVKEFLQLHAQSRLIEDIDSTVDKIIEEANKLAGESFREDTDITSLSGGQSRALMIADTAILSKSPIVLIDEIENAGIDRKKALELLVSKDKIVLMATHDPTLALISDMRIVINNGGIKNIIKTSEKEKSLLEKLEVYDEKFKNMRKALRYGEYLDDIEL
ncbi:ABC transporter, ATP-binding protein [Peptoanaerobacter stomatis]|uniref:ABC transporter, ATP-binding protein n=1 Tax=Peptoanaerobacter stomatis TaxID=796937 RepID=J4W0Y3_9FIRM|nr:ATP-binding cassette domain-containing protein [Peptoanaerobacter stomatis]EJU19956.1 ABC transporter, ATP-binding protein [Peptoanaerobacter stomatis]NWO26076.1 ATP-binding cassette domain-containing protein [Peptostreptococcaceae bacterium oral taxon 081]